MKAVRSDWALFYAGFNTLACSVAASFSDGPLLVAAIFAVTTRPRKFPLFTLWLAIFDGVNADFTVTGNGLANDRGDCYPSRR